MFLGTARSILTCASVCLVTEVFSGELFLFACHHPAVSSLCGPVLGKLLHKKEVPLQKNKAKVLATMWLACHHFANAGKGSKTCGHLTEATPGLQMHRRSISCCFMPHTTSP